MPNAPFGRFQRAVFGIRVWVSFGVMALAVTLALAITPGIQRRRRLVRWGADTCFWLAGTPLRVRGLELIPAAGCVLVANHASYLDGVVLTAVLPPRFAFVIKREMTKVPLAHFLLRRIGSEFVERFDRQRGAMDARRILRSARRQAALAFFPEGTFRPEPGLRRFHLGAFAAAAQGQLPVVPVVIRGSRAMLPAESAWPRPGRIEVIIRPPLGGSAAQPARDLMAQARASILAHLDEPDLT